MAHKRPLHTPEAEVEGWRQGQSQPELMPRLSSGEKTRVEAGDKEWWCLPKPQEGDLADGQISVTRQPEAGIKRSLRVVASCQSLESPGGRGGLGTWQ